MIKLIDNFLIEFMAEHNFGFDFFLTMLIKDYRHKAQFIYFNRHDKVNLKQTATNLYDQSEIN